MSEIDEDPEYYDEKTGVWASAPGGTQYKKDLPLMKTKFSDEEQYLYYYYMVDECDFNANPTGCPGSLFE